MELQRKAVNIANGLGAKIGIGPTCPGQHLVLSPGKDATKFLRENRGNLDDAATEILNQIPASEDREELVAFLSSEMKQDIELAKRGGNGHLVTQYDFRSLLELAPLRGDSWDYYNVQKMNVLGLAIFFPGQKSRVYADIISPDLRHSAEAAAAALVEGATCALNRVGRNPDLRRLVFWADCGRHFRNRFIAYEILANNCFEIPTVELCFDGENHGKSIVDGHFNCLGTCVKNAHCSWGNPPFD